jgi:hypothetical protein
MANRAQILLQRIEEKARRGHRGDPVGTVALYGPDDKLASKLVVGISPSARAGVTETKKWLRDGDVREDAALLEEVLAFLAKSAVRSVVMTRGVFGCPHEEGIDYPEGGSCEACPYWKGRDRSSRLLVT